MKIETAKKKAKLSLEQLDKMEDKYTKYVKSTASSLFNKGLDSISADQLAEYGTKLSGVYAYLLNKSAEKRAERDTYEQLYDEAYNDAYLEYKSNDNNVTDARAKAQRDCADIKKVVVAKNYEKNDIENLIRACERLTSFIQSAIKVKEEEKYKNYD